MQATATASMKVLIVEEKDILREKIACILSREHGISMVIQVASYSMLKKVVGETSPALVLGDFFEFNRYCKDNRVTSVELCPDANILLYTDGDDQPYKNETGMVEDPQVFNVRRIQREVSNFLKVAKRKKKDKAVKNIKGAKK